MRKSHITHYEELNAEDKAGLKKDSVQEFQLCRPKQPVMVHFMCIIIVYCHYSQCIDLQRRSYNIIWNTTKNSPVVYIGILY